MFLIIRHSFPCQKDCISVNVEQAVRFGSSCVHCRWEVWSWKHVPIAWASNSTRTKWTAQSAAFVERLNDTLNSNHSLNHFQQALSRDYSRKLAMRQDSSLDGLPVLCRAQWTPKGQFILAHPLPSMFLKSERKPKYPEQTHTESVRTPKLRLKPGTLELWDGNATCCPTLLILIYLIYHNTNYVVILQSYKWPVTRFLFHVLYKKQMYSTPFSTRVKNWVTDECSTNRVHLFASWICLMASLMASLCSRTTGVSEGTVHALEIHFWHPYFLPLSVFFLSYQLCFSLVLPINRTRPGTDLDRPLYTTLQQTFS